MNICSEYKERQLRDYFLNRLTPEEVADFQFHLFHCETCRKNLERMRLMAYEEKDTTVSFSFSVITRVAAVVGLLVVLAVGGYYFHASSSDDGLPLETNEPPVLHAGDSVEAELDSTVLKLNWKDECDERVEE